ncbi:MAG: DUF4183 domain-containing protein [Candidatus Pelethousia sp.]|nr:DUF4183 domain-containing protein [Candidatus Pelethousia sp.]
MARVPAEKSSRQKNRNRLSFAYAFACLQVYFTLSESPNVSIRHTLVYKTYNNSDLVHKNLVKQTSFLPSTMIKAGDTMALQLLKLVMSATQPTTTTHPEVKNFFYQVPIGGLTDTTFTIPDTSWIGDDGSQVAAGGLSIIASDNGYAQLTINGQLQQVDVLTTLSATEVVIDFPTSTTLEEDKWVVLTVTNFSPVTTAPIIS